MPNKEVEITIKQDGTIEFDQQGFEGKACDGAIDDLLKAMGKVLKNTKKKDYHKKVKRQEVIRQKIQ